MEDIQIFLEKEREINRQNCKENSFARFSKHLGALFDNIYKEYEIIYDYNLEQIEISDLEGNRLFTCHYHNPNTETWNNFYNSYDDDFYKKILSVDKDFAYEHFSFESGLRFWERIFKIKDLDKSIFDAYRLFLILGAYEDESYLVSDLIEAGKFDEIRELSKNLYDCYFIAKIAHHIP